jgi:ABC-2 type transport system permease protein
MLAKVWAFLKKDFLLESSYRISFLFNIFEVVVSILVYFFIDKLFGQRITRHLQEFGVNYFSYVLLSMAFFSYVGAGLGSFSNRIYYEQIQGTLEAILLTPTRPPLLLFSLAVWNLLSATLNIAIYIVSGIFLFGINFANLNILSTAVIMVLTIVSFSSLGILSASVILVIKRGNPVGWIISNLEGLLGGVYFPITILPGWLQFLAKFFPITYAIRAIQLAVYRGYSIVQLKREVGFLLFFSLLLLPLSLLSFKYALNTIRRQGSISQY